MKVIDKKTGMTYEAPDDTTPEEAQQMILRLRGQGQPMSTPPPTAELREQPSWAQQQIQPGGWVSPENLGVLGGASLGAQYGAAFPPYGPIVGGIAGAALGAMAGRSGEVLSRRIFGPTYAGPVQGTVPLEQMPQPTLSEDVRDIGQAGVRGALAQTAGEIGGVLTNKAIGAIGQKMVPRITSQGAEAARTLADAGVPVTAGETLDSKLLRFGERLSAESPLSSRGQAFYDQQGRAVEQAVRDVAAPLGEAADQSLAGVELQAGLRGYAQQVRARTKEALTRFMEQVSPGSVESLEQAGKRGWEGLQAARKNAAAEGNKLYRAAYAVTNGDEMPMPRLSEALGTLEGEEGGLGVFVTGLIRKGKSVMSANTPEAAGASGLVDQFGRALGAAEAPEAMASLETMHTVSSELGKIIDSSVKRYGLGMDREGRAATLLKNALRSDMGGFAEKYPDAGPLLSAADTYWGENVAKLFSQNATVRDLRQLAKSGEYLRMVPTIFDPANGQAPLQAIKKAAGFAGTDVYENMAAAWGQSLVDKAVDASGNFSFDAFGRQLAEIERKSPGYLAEALPKIGNKLQAFTQAWSAYQPERSVSALTQYAERSTPERTLGAAFANARSAEPVKNLRQALGDSAVDRAAAAWYNGLVERSQTDGIFSPQKFLTQVNRLQAESPEFLPAVLTPAVAERLVQLTEALNYVSRGSKGVGNPSRSGFTWAAISQLTGIVSGITSMLGGAVTGSPGMMLGGAGTLGVSVSPAVAGRLLFSEKGIQWLTRGTQATTPGEMATAVTRLVALASIPSQGEREQQRIERWQRENHKQMSPSEQLRAQVQAQTGKVVVDMPRSVDEALRGVEVHPN